MYTNLMRHRGLIPLHLNSHIYSNFQLFLGQVDQGLEGLAVFSQEVLMNHLPDRVLCLLGNYFINVLACLTEILKSVSSHCTEMPPSP